MTTKRPKTETKPTAGARKARKAPATGKPEHAPPGLTREHVKTLPEREKNRLRAEALALVTKGQAATGNETLALSEADEERLEDLIRYGMLPCDPPPPRPITPGRNRELRDLARQRLEADAAGGFMPLLLHDAAEAERVRALGAEITAERLEAERVRLEAVLAAVEDRGSIFARLGELWLVADNGRRAPLLPDRKGMHYVRAILKAGNAGLTPRELCGMVNLLPPGDASNVEQGENTPTPGTDADGREIDHADAQDARGWGRAAESRGFRITPEQYADAVEELKERLRGAQRDGDREHARTVRKALRELGEGDPTARTGKRLPPNRGTERMRDSVRRAIERTLREIGTHHPAAAAYLGEHVKTVAGRWRYTGKPFTT